MNTSTALKRHCLHLIAKPPNPFDDRFSVFDRQEKVPGFSQEALRKAKVVIVGCGGIGCRIARTVCRMGIGAAAVIDPDKVEDSNLHRQDLYFHKDVTKWKAFAAVRNLARHCTALTELTGYNLKFEEVLLLGETFSDAGCFVCGVDNDDAREAACRHFGKLGVPGVFIAVDLQASSGSVLIQRKGEACWGCTLPPGHKNTAAPCGTAASPEILDVVCGLGVFALTSLLMQRPIGWNYRLVTLPAFMPDVAETLERKSGCDMCS